MVRIDRWMVRNTLAWLGDRYRCAENHTIGHWGINLSGDSLSDSDFCQELVQQVRRAGLPEGTLCFEITESAAIAQLSKVSELIQALKALGCRFALDDFGTGFSSLTYLRTLPVDVIKIDKSFVRNMLTDANDRAIVESVIFLAQRFDHPVVAEGVETLEHATALRDMGCNLVQGYGIARPIPSDEVLGWLDNWRRRIHSSRDIRELQTVSEQGDGI